MASRPDDCDRDRLRLSLEDRLTDEEQAGLAAHLEGCEPCRLDLERMAAESRYWGDAARLLGGSPGVEEAGDLPDDGWPGLLEPPDPERPGSIGRLGRYDVMEILGRGGMGLVLKAVDPSLGRTVAIKVLNPALAHAASARRRFEREGKAVAAVAHEHIVTIHSVDELRGLPCLVMEYVPGRSVQEKLDACGPLEVREVLRIATQAARALSAAHAQGIIHRDIKPANILLQNCVERVKLTDFGLARAVDDASLTQSGLIAGTPQYMAPEQARGEPVDARADLFALGAVLYAMAVGRPPFRADSALAVLRRVCDDRHRPIRELNPDVPAWLEAIVDRLLAKDPDDRFATAAEVADLLEKGLAHLQQPTTLPPPAVPGARSLTIGREPRSGVPRRLAMAAALVLAAVAGIGASDAAGLTQVSDYVATILRIRTADGTLIVKVDDPNVKLRIDGDEVVIGGAGPQEIRVRAGKHRVQAIRDGKPVRESIVTVARGGKETVQVDFEPGEDSARVIPSPTAMSQSDIDLYWQLLESSRNKAAGLWDRPELNRSVPQKPDTPAQLRPGHVRFTTSTEPGGETVSDVITFRVTAKLDPGYRIYKHDKYDKVPDRSPVPTTFDFFDTGGEEVLGDWIASREPTRRKDPAFPDWPFTEFYENAVSWSIKLRMRADSPPGKEYRVQVGYVVGKDRSCSTPVRWTLPGHPIVMVGGGIGTVEGRPQDDPARARAMVWSLAYSPDGRQLAIAQQAIDRAESVLRVRDLERRTEQVWVHKNAGFRSVAFSTSGRVLAAGHFDGTITYLEGRGPWRIEREDDQRSAINAVAFVPFSHTLLAGDWDGWVGFQGPDPIPNYTPLRYPGRVWSLAVSPDGSTLAVGGEAKTVQIFDLKTRRLKTTLQGHDHPVESLAFSPDSKTLVSAGGQLVRFWETATWKESAPPIRHQPEVICVRFSPDGKLLAISDGESYLPHYKVLSTSVILWDVERRAEVRRLWGHTNTIWALAFSPDGKTLASGSADQTVRFWDVDTGRLRETLVPGASAEPK